MGFLIGFLIPLAILIIILFSLGSGSGRPYKSSRIRRRDRYRAYLKTDAWQRKRYVVFKRDNWTCQECGAKATEVHHLKYAKYQIGKEPIDWLVSLCSPCHRKKHN